MSLLREQLLRKALAALSEVADTCDKHPAPRSLLLRFALAYTFAEAGFDPKKRWIWDEFWRHATAPVGSSSSSNLIDPFVRGTGARSALAAICRETGYEPDNAFLNHIRRRREK